jgi:hypothetical protein
MANVQSFVVMLRQVLSHCVYHYAILCTVIFLKIVKLVRKVGVIVVSGISCWFRRDNNSSFLENRELTQEAGRTAK